MSFKQQMSKVSSTFEGPHTFLCACHITSICLEQTLKVSKVPTFKLKAIEQSY